MALIFKGNATHHRNLLFLYSVVGFVNMPIFFFSPKAKKSETKPSNLCCQLRPDVLAAYKSVGGLKTLK